MLLSAEYREILLPQQILYSIHRMYPTDETANLNAAIIRLNNGDADAAKPYLDRAGDSKEADAARKAYEMMMMQ